MIELADQLALESLMVDEGMDRYRKQLTESIQAQQETMSKPQRFFMVQAIKPLSEAITKLVNEVYNGKPGKKSISVSYLKETDHDVVAYLTAKSILDVVSSEVSTTKVASLIGNRVQEHILFNKFKKSNPDFFKRVKKKLATTVHTAQSQATAMGKYLDIAEIDKEKYKPTALMNLGMALIKLFADETGLVEIKEMGSSRPPLLKATEKAYSQLQELHNRCELMHPVFMPMIIKPAPWTDPFNGGYVTQRLPIIKSWHKAYLEELRSVEMPKVYSAINAIQETPWRVNTRVYGVMSELWESGSTLAGIPDQELTELNPLPWGLPQAVDKEILKQHREQDPETWNKFKTERKSIHEANRRKQSKRFSFLRILNTAQRMKKYEQFWFPYQMDWRGRMYPVVGTFNPQGQDAAKGAMEFAEGKPLGENGVMWLQIHLANCYGIDKVSYQDRMTWTLLNEEAILLSAKDPLTHTFWMEADSGGKAWQFLAACFAYADYREHGVDYPCHLPIGLDGSCNGLQHLSALVLDPYGAANTNLVDADKPADIYQIVANAVAHDVADDAQNGNKYAQLWHGKVTRSVVKRNVMTVSYGATKYGMLEQLREDLHKATDGKFREWLGVEGEEQDFPYLKYLSELIIKHIDDTVKAAPQVMGWLQKVAQVVTSNGLPVRWTTPSGLPVLQSYRKTKEKRLDTTLCGDFRLAIQVKEPTNQQDTKRSSLGISPNVIHSLDASHMMATVNGMLDAGISGFAMVHDSYGTHACDVQEMAITLREKFVEMYEVDQLSVFLGEIKQQLPESLVAELPKPLPRGEFDLELVKEANYFFA